MVEQEKDFIAFDVNETLCFDRGQEIAEMLSISLEPDISLQRYESYVQIRGVILLSGSYKKAINLMMMEGTETEKEVTAYMEKVIDKNETEADFQHKFPLDISIPNERVRNIEEVTVTIEAFDYELPDHHTLKVKAMIHILGLQSERNEEDVTIEEESVELEDTVEVVDVEEETVDEETMEEEIAEEIVEVESHKQELEKVKSEIIDSSGTNEIDISLSQSVVEEEEEQVKNVQFLTDLFGGVEEEGVKSTITIYIIQEEDTVESISKRFKIPALQLVKDNNLTEEKLTEGQLLHITRN